MKVTKNKKKSNNPKRRIKMKKAMAMVAAGIMTAGIASTAMAGDYSFLITFKPVNPRDVIIASMKADVKFVYERIETDGDGVQGTNTWIKLTVKNDGFSTIKNVHVKFAVNEFLDNPAANINYAPHLLTTNKVSLRAKQRHTFVYRLSSEVWADQEENLRGLHYKAEIIANDDNQNNNTITREVDSLNKSGSI
jgi:hypothetical protein